MKASKQDRSHRKQLIIVPAATSELYRQAADNLARKFQRPPSAKTLMLLAIRRHNVSSILEDFYGWNELSKRYQLLTSGQLRRQVIQSRRVE